MKDQRREDERRGEEGKGEGEGEERREVKYIMVYRRATCPCHWSTDGSVQRRLPHLRQGIEKYDPKIDIYFLKKLHKLKMICYAGSRNV